MTYRRLLLGSVYGVALAGWGAVWVAEWVHPVWMLATLAALLLGPWLDVRGNHPLKPAWNRVLLALGIGLAFADWRWLTGSWFLAIVLLLMYVSAVRALSPKANRDLAQLVALGFLQLLAASVLTLNLGYALFFLVVFLLLPWALLAVAVKAELEGEVDVLRGRVALAGAVEVPPLADRVLTRGVAVAMLTALVLTAAVTVGFFLAFPRLNVGTFAGQLGLAERARAGLNDQVELGGRGDILTNSAPALRLVPLAGTHVPEDRLYLRAIALDRFDGRRWSNTQSLRYESASHRGIDLVHGSTRPTHHYRVLLADLGVDLLPLVPVARQLNAQAKRIGLDPLGAVRIADLEGGFKYEIAADPAAYWRDDIDWATLNPLTELPADMQNLEPLRALPAGVELPPQIFANADVPDLVWVGRQLREFATWNYTLTLPDADDHLAALFANRAGHCEIFATAMALMLRAAGIPAVVVNGFRGGEYFAGDGYYLVRQRNAHSWVEFMHPALGDRWIPLDPTPPSPPLAGWRQRAAEAWQQLADRIQFFWFNNIATYDLVAQREAVRGTRELAKGSGKRLKALGATVRAWMADMGRVLVWLAVLVVVAVLAWLLWALRGRGGGARRGMQRDTTPPWLRRWLRQLERRYGKRPRAQPLDRWLAQLPLAAPLRRRLRAFAAAYAAWRFGGQGDVRALRRRAAELARQVRRTPRYT